MTLRVTQSIYQWTIKMQTDSKQTETEHRHIFVVIFFPALFVFKYSFQLMYLISSIFG